jgi:hypothetical protein
MHAVAGRAALKGRFVALGVGLAVPALLLSGCGSSKPTYCTKVSELKSAVSALSHLNLSKEGISGAEAAVHKLHSSATGLVEAAKSEFPQQSEAVATAAKELASSVKAASNPQTRSSAASQIPAELVALGSGVNEFLSATKSKCE